jgi:hypothetical protein
MRLWTTTWGRHFLSTRVGMEDGRAWVRQRRHERGVRRRRLRPRHLKAKPEAPAAFTAEREARLEDWERIVVDDATVRRQPPLPAPWGWVDEGPEVPTGDDHPKGPVYGAGAPLTGRTHEHSSPELRTRAVAQCLPHLWVSPPGQRLRVIHDRGEPQTGPPVAVVVQEAHGRLMRKAQPADSPERNPHERLWQWLRRVGTHHHGFATLGEQMDALRNFFRYLAGVKDHVRRFCGVNTPESFVASL